MTDATVHGRDAIRSGRASNPAVDCNDGSATELSSLRRCCADSIPGPVRADPSGFASWLESAVGSVSTSGPIVIVGLVLEVCVLATLIEINLRGYPATVMFEGVNTYDGDAERKRAFLDTLAGYWGRPVTWADCVAETLNPRGLTAFRDQSPTEVGLGRVAEIHCEAIGNFVGFLEVDEGPDGWLAGGDTRCGDSSRSRTR